MRRLWRPIDWLIGAGLAALAALAGSQLSAFAHQYHQRLGGHLDEARLFQRRILAQAADGGEALAETARLRVGELARAAEAIADAGPFAKPFVVLAHLDWQIADGTLTAFQPALPLDLASLVYAAGTAALVLCAYAALKASFARRGTAKMGST